MQNLINDIRNIIDITIKENNLENHLNDKQTLKEISLITLLLIKQFHLYPKPLINKFIHQEIHSLTNLISNNFPKYSIHHNTSLVSQTLTISPIPNQIENYNFNSSQNLVSNKLDNKSILPKLIQNNTKYTNNLSPIQIIKKKNDPIIIDTSHLIPANFDSSIYLSNPQTTCLNKNNQNNNLILPSPDHISLNNKYSNLTKNNLSFIKQDNILIPSLIDQNIRIQKKKKNLSPPTEKLDPNIIHFCKNLESLWTQKNNLQKINYLKNKIHYLKNIKQPEQRSTEWYNFRRQMLTASDLYKSLSTIGIRRALIIKKCKPYVHSGPVGKACKHGIKYEDVAILIYEKINKVKIYDYGCIQDQEFKIFGASPDGICGEENLEFIGRMVEIKCPISRTIIHGKVPDMYWKQIQGQLEVCKLWDCDYFECKIIEISDDEFYSSNHQYKGIVLTIYNNIQEKSTFIYSPISLNNNEFKNWIDQEFDKIIEFDHLSFLSSSFWILKNMNCVLVKRRPLWFHSIKHKIQNFWDEVLYHRKHGYEILEQQVKKKKKLNQSSYTKITDIKECIIHSDSD